MADLDPDSLNKLRVVDLREHLSSRGLPTSGLKAELVKRLREAILTSEENESDVESKQRSEEDEMDADTDETDSNSSNRQVPDIMDREEEAGSKIMKNIESEVLSIEEAGRRLSDEGVNLAEDEAMRHEEEARVREEEEARKRDEEVARMRAEEEARLKAEEETRLKAEEEARLKAEEEARLKAEEEARLKAEEEARLKAEEEARLKAEEEARLKAEEEARLRAEQETRMRAEQEAKLRAEEEAKRKAEEAKRRAEEAMRKTEEEAKKAEEARWRAEIEARRKAEEEAMRRAEEEAKKANEARWRAEEEARRRAQEEAQQKAEEEARLKARQRAEEEAKRKADMEAKMKSAEESKLKAEMEARLKDEKEARIRAEEDDSRMLVDERGETEQEQRSHEEYTKRQAEELRQRQLAEQRQKQIAEEQRRLKEEQIQKFEERQRRLEKEEKIKRIAAERRLEEEERQRKLDEQKLSEEDIRLPQAIEKVLALQSERAQLLGVDPDVVMESLSGEKSIQKGTVTLIPIDEDEVNDEEELTSKSKESKRRRKKKKKKRSRITNSNNELNKSDSTFQKEKEIDIDVEYIQEVIDVSDPMYTQFMKIFERFKLSDEDKEKELTPAESSKEKQETVNPMLLRKKPVDLDDDDDKDDDEKVEEEKPKLSKRKLKKLSRMTVAELKQKVTRPELVEMHDVTARDPVLLLHLKASRNTVPVPRHWCFKRKYLQGKRGIEKPAFELPDFIKRTGIMEMRQALQEKEDQKTMKAKMRERVRPKLGKIDIDYQKLHDAFFKWQTKPKMTIHGDLYYEGKEFETRLKEKKPGDLSEDLRTALGMPTGPNAQKCPPPWLIAMQRYGPPPSYPNLKIRGLNAPIPEDCSFGYHAGGWGKPPVDESGRPLYGDVFGLQVTDNGQNMMDEEIDHTLWGELESESSEEEEDEDEEEDEEDEEKVEDESGLVTPAEGLITPSGFSSIPAGMETPDMIELRKRKVEEIEGGDTPALYTIVPEKKTERLGAAMMGSTHIYDLAGAIPANKAKVAGTSSVAPQGIEVALDPSELEMDSAAMAARYEQTMREQQSQLEKEDLSDMVAEHAARQKNKRKKQQLTSAKPPKKYKEFKF